MTLNYLNRTCINIVKSTIACTFLMTSLSYANPSGGAVAAGKVTISSPSPNTVQINQTSNKAIINWQSFNIGAHEATHFQQPAGGVTLNRINAQQGASQIYGLLSANGTIILVNQAGIFFGPSAHVNVGGLIASTSDITNQHFLAGKYIFDQTSPYAGSIINQGSITAAKYGLVALVGTGVQNDGYIHAKWGNIVLASGNKFTIDLSGNQLINFTIDEGTSVPGVDQHGRALKDGVKNTGSLIAEGGTILISAATASSVLDHSINMSGLAQATTVGKHHGEIIFSGGSQGVVRIAGKINVSGKDKNQTGGKIKIVGEKINIESPAILDASGTSGGGVIVIGENSLITKINPNVIINASAISTGNGGSVAVWSDEVTQVYGDIYAKGGKSSGNGGLIETSSHHYLDVNNIHIDTSAPHGIAGNWLLDPSDLTISASSDTNVTSTSPFQPGNQLSNSILNISTLLNALTNGNVIIQTGAGSGPGNGDIFVNTAINWSNANSLTLSAYRNITSSASIINTGGANLVLRSDNTGTGVGTVSFSAGKNVTLSGGSGTVSIYYNPAIFGTQDTLYVGGTTPIQYMLVNNAVNLQNINNNLSGNFALGNNISLSGNFTPIGSSATPYTGNFDGQNYTIDHLQITNTTPNVDLGLFGVINLAKIKNVNLSNVTISETTNNLGSSIYIGSLVGLNNGGSIENSSVTNPVITATGTNFGTSGSRGYYDIGGLIGATMGGTISESASLGGIITNNVNTNANASNLIAFNEVGGLIGGEHNSATLSNAYSTTAIVSNGNVIVSDASATGELLVGGLIGRLDTLSTASNTYSTGAVHVTSTLSSAGAGYVLVGGLIGITSIVNSPSTSPPPVVDNSYSSSDVTLHATLTNSSPGAATFLAGGLLGQSNGILTNSHSSGHVVATLASDLTSSSESFYVGGLAGDNFTEIENSYSTSPLIVTGNNYGNQISIGGLIGGNLTLFDKEITGSYSSGLLNVAINNYAGGQIFSGGFSGLNIYFGNPPPARLPFQNDYSTSIQNVSGVNDGSLTVIGGFVGANGIDGSNPGGDIVDSYSSGYVNNNVATLNGGTTNAGGFLGQTISSTDPLSPPVNLASNFYDTGTSGFNQNQGVGNLPGAVTGVIPGCFGGGACPNGGSADLSSQATFNVAGWNFATIWGIINNASYPYLISSSPTPPQVISGTTPLAGGALVNLVSNGNIIDTTLTGPNGFFYFYEPTGTIANTSLGLVYLSGAAIKGNGIFTPALDGSGAGITLTSDAIRIGSSSTLAIANNQLSTLINGLNDNNILYSGLGSDITIGTNLIPNVDFITTPTTTYQLNGTLNNIAGGNGSMTFNGPVVLIGNSSIKSNNVTFANTVSGSYALTLNNSGATNINNGISIGSLSVNANAINLNTSSVLTTGTQYYNNLVNLGVNTILTASNITFFNGISGGRDLSLVGQSGDNQFIVDGDLNLGNVTLTGSNNGNNYLTLKTNSPEIWTITNTNAGGVTGIASINGQFNFSNFANLVGGERGNTFNFNDGTTLTGTIDGANLANVNTANFSSYVSPFNVNLSNNIYAGSVISKTLLSIVRFNNINSLIGNDISVITLANKKNKLTLTSFNAGYIDDPLNYSRFNQFVSQSGTDSVNFIAAGNYNTSSGALSVNGMAVQLSHFNYHDFTGNITFSGDESSVPTSPSSLVSSEIAAIIAGGTPLYKNANLFQLNAKVVNELDETIKQVKTVLNSQCESGIISTGSKNIVLQAMCSFK